MRNAIDFLSVIGSIIILLVLSCNSTKQTGIKSDSIFFLDVVENSGLDTLKTELNQNDGTTTIAILEKNKPVKITVVLQANAAQTNEKGLRVLVRNTDIEPDYCFMDLKYQPEMSEWLVTNIGVINSSSSSDNLFIKRVEVNKTVNEICENKAVCDLSKTMHTLNFLK